MPAVYDDEKTKDDELRKITGINPADEKAMEARAHDGLAAAEANAVTQTPSRAEEIEAKMNNFVYSELDKSGMKGKFTSKLLGRRQLVGGGIASTIVGLFLFVAFVAQGPLALVHFSQLLSRFHFMNDSTFMNSRAGNLFKYKTTTNDPTRRNLGFAGNILADHYTTKLKANGIEQGYEGRRLRTLSIDPDTSAGKRALSTMRDRGVDLPDPDPNTGRIAVRLDGTARQRRYIIAGMVDGMDLNGISSAIAKRVLKVRAQVDLHPLKNISRRADEKLFDYRKRVKEGREKRRSHGVDSTNRSSSAADADEDGDGTLSDEESANSSDRTLAAEGANELNADATGEGSIRERTGKIRGKLGKAAGVAGVVALTCGIYQLGELIPIIRDSNITKPLMRIGMGAVAAGSQIQTLDKKMDLNMDEIGTYYDDLYDEETGTHAVGARSIQAELGQDPTGPDLPEGSRPGYEQPAFFATIESMVEGLPGGPTTCAVATSAVGGFIIDGAGWALAATGPIGFVINAGTDVAIGVAANMFIDDLIRWLAGEQVNMNPAGALFGNEANYGALLAGNEAAMSHGGVALSDQEVSILDMERNTVLNSELRNKSIYARYFDLTEPGSLFAKATFETPVFNSPQATIASIFSSPTTGFTSSLRSVLFKSVGAQGASEYDYGFPEFGFTLAEMEDESYEDPYANADKVEENLEELNEEYGKVCFGTTVDPTSFALQPGTATQRYDELDPKCMDKSDKSLMQYRFYLADMTAAKTIMCYEGLEEKACQEIGLEPSSNSGADGDTAPVGTNPGGAIIGDPYSDTTSIPCAEGTRDIGLQDAYRDGTLFRSRMCSVSNFPSVGQADIPGGTFSTPGADGHAIVNSRVSGAWYKLVEDAKAAGVTLSAGSSFRSMPHQQSLWSSNPNTQYVARPGHSPHQAGVAIDFNGMHVKGGSTCATRATHSGAGYQWLRANAGNYGFKQYSAEAWHWDALPAANRC